MEAGDQPEPVTPLAVDEPDPTSPDPVATPSAETAATAPAQDPHRFRLGNRPPLTGIRALALCTVLTYHANFKTMPGAWEALQVFFVLSGFLITAMLAGEGMRNGRISLKGFYARRAVRLLPPLLLTVALLGIYASFVHVANASQRVWGDSLAALFYYADYRQAFGHAPFFGYLAQTWSLSVEEQFYILWSILMVAAVATHHRRLAYGFAIAGLALSAGDRLWQVYSAHHFYTPANVAFTRVYYAFDTRADALFLGCLLGLLAADGHLHRWRPWAVRLLTVAAVVSAVFMVWILFHAPLFTENLAVWWLPLTTVASAVIIAFFVICPQSVGSRLVGLGVFVFIGDLSYTVYLVHFPVYLAIGPNGTGWGFWPTQVVRLAVIFAIAIASWFLIEKPLMGWRQRSAARAIGPTNAEP
ncbi:MAG: acyltransferase family protein [Acidimicrobiales bacterium]